MYKAKFLSPAFACLLILSLLLPSVTPNLAGVALAEPAANTPPPNVNVTMRNYTNDRLGANNAEARLTVSNVTTNTFGKLFTRKVDDPTRNLLERQEAYDVPTVVPLDTPQVTPIASNSITATQLRTNPGQIYAQPLYVAGLDVPGKGKRNVVFVASQRNNLYAFDADDPNEANPLWYRQLGPYGVSPLGEFGTRYRGQFTDVYPFVGIVSTPVIDLATFTMYVVAFNRDVSGNTRTFRHRLHAIDIRTGEHKNLGAGTSNPRIIEGSVVGTGADGLPNLPNYSDNDPNKVTFESRQHMQRPALTLANGTLYVAFGSYAGTNPYHGWLFAYDAPTMNRLAIWCATPDTGSAVPDVDEGQGAMWNSGHGPAVDERGVVYVVTANGTANYSPPMSRSLGNSAVKLTLTRDPISPSTLATFTVGSFYTPSNREFLRIADQDLGVSGIGVLPSNITASDGSRLVYTGSKEGRIILMKRDNLGGFVASPGQQNFYQRWQVTPPRFGSEQNDDIVGRHIHGLPAFYNVPNGAAQGLNLYVMGEADYLKQYKWDSGSSKFITTPVYTSSVSAPEKGPYDDPRRNGPQSIPGGTLTVTSNNGQVGTGIVWVYHQLCGDANIDAKPGIVRAFDAADIRNELWHSEQVPTNPAVPNICPPAADPPENTPLPPAAGYTSRDGNWGFSKFTQPIVTDGKVFVPTFSGQLIVYGLFSSIVTKPTDDGKAGSFSYAVANATPGDTIYFNRQLVTDTVSLTVNMTGTLQLQPYVAVQGSACGQAPILIKGANAKPNTVGLTLAGNNTVTGLHIAGFPAQQIKNANGGTGNILRCVRASKSAP
jgi:hypothetical protein